MVGVRREHKTRELGRAFPASRYDDPRGGRPTALERNILRYRAIEATLYLFYAEEVRSFMLASVYPQAVGDAGAGSWDSATERRLEWTLSQILRDAESARKLSVEDAQAIRLAVKDERQQGKKLKTAFTYAIKIGMFSETEANEMKELLDYRNDIAHRIHLVMADVSRSHLATDHLAFTAPTYKGDALNRLRAYRLTLWNRAPGRLCLQLSSSGLLFELAKRAYENDLKRLDRLIETQIDRESARVKAINAELNLGGTEFVSDLHPRFPANHHPGRSYCDDYAPPTGHLTIRGVEICYRLYDMGKHPMAVAYLMGMSLRAAQNRRKGWLKAGGLQRIRAEVRLYDLAAPQKPPSGDGSGGI